MGNYMQGQKNKPITISKHQPIWICSWVIEQKFKYLYHFLGNIIWDVFMQVKGKLNGFILFVFPFKFLYILNAQQQLYGH